MAQYRFGTVAVTQGSAIVVGTGTEWLTNVAPGYLFAIQKENVWYEVLSVQDDTHLTLKSNYVATDKSNSSYAVQNLFTTTQKFPLPSYGDVDTASLLGLALAAIDIQLSTIKVMDATKSRVFILNKGFTGTLLDAAGISINRGDDPPASLLFRADHAIKGWELAGDDLSDIGTLRAQSIEIADGIASEHISETTNLFFTNTRARNAISATAPISYNSGTGVISFAGLAASSISFAPGGAIAATTVQAAIIELDNEKQPLLGYTPLNATLKGVANGLAELDATGKVPLSQLPPAVTGAMSYKGVWNATTNSPAIPAASSLNMGYFYKVSVAGTTMIDGVNDWMIGDWIVSNGSSWDKIDNTDQVTRVAGLQGDILASSLKTALTLVKADVGLGNVDNTSDANKPLSSAATTALGLKQDTSAKGAANGYASLDATGKVPTAQIPSLASGASNNLIINGDFGIWQRGTSFTTQGYTADRWALAFSGGTSRTVSFVANTDPDGSSYVMQVAANGGGASSSYDLIRQLMEGVRWTAGKTISLSFWARVLTGTGNISTEFFQYFGTGGSPSSDVNALGVTKHALTTTWTRFVVEGVAIPSIAGKTLGSNGNDALCLNIWLDAGSNFNSQTSTLGAGNKTVQIRDVMVEVSSTASAVFSRRSPGEELCLCQRYFRTNCNGGADFALVRLSSSGVFAGTPPVVVPFSVPMRTNPVMTAYTSAARANPGNINVDGTTTAAISTINVNISNVDIKFWNATALSGVDHYLYFYADFNAEL